MIHLSVGQPAVNSEQKRDVTLPQALLFLPGVISLFVLGIYPFREAGGLVSGGLVRHVFGLSGLAALVAVAFLIAQRQNVSLQATHRLLLLAGAGLAAMACLLYLPIGTAFLALVITQSGLLALLLLQRASSRVIARMHLARLKWLTILIPPVFILAVTLGVYVFHFTGSIGHEAEHLALTIILFAGTFPFALFVFRVFENIQGEILSQRDELSRLHQEATRRSQQLRTINSAGLDLTSVLSLEFRASRLVDLGRELTGATDGSLLLLDETRSPRWFLINGSGCPSSSGQLFPWAEAVDKICECDLCAMLIPWPESPPASDASITVSLQWQDGILGLLTLVHADGVAFTTEDRDIIGMYAQWGTLAIKNAQLYQQVKALAVMEERDRIAREMHDNFGQMLGYMNTKAQAVGLLIASSRNEEARLQLRELEDAAQELYEDVRDEMSGLRATRWLDQGLLTALRAYANQFEEANGIETVIEIEAERTVPLSLEAQLQVFRVVQEALANVRKHAEAPRAVVSVHANGDDLRVVVRDEGRGFFMPDVDGGRFGLRTMKERAEALGGQLDVESAPGTGTTVALQVPLAIGAKVPT